MMDPPQRFGTETSVIMAETIRESAYFAINVNYGSTISSFRMSGQSRGLFALVSVANSELSNPITARPIRIRVR